MLSKYDIFCKVVECGSFTKAACEMGYSQSSVSQAIKSLENESGAILLKRGKEGISLTVDGEQLYPYYIAITTATQALDRKQSEMHSLEDQEIKLGTFTSVSRDRLPALIQKFMNVYPNISFTLHQGTYTEIANMIRAGDVDFGFTELAESEGLEAVPLFTDELVAVIPQDHPLASQSSVSLSRLSKFPFILEEEGNDSTIINIFRRHGISPNVRFVVYDDYTIANMVRQGLGVTALYERVIAGYDDNVISIPIREHPERNIVLASTGQNTMSLAASKFYSFLLKSDAFK